MNLQNKTKWAKTMVQVPKDHVKSAKDHGPNIVQVPKDHGPSAKDHGPNDVLSDKNKKIILNKLIKIF